MAKRRNHAKLKARRYWRGVRQHERTSLLHREQPRPASTRSQIRRSQGKPNI